MPPPPLQGRGHNKIMWRPFWFTFDNIDTRVDIAVIKACKIKTCIDNKTFQYNADNISLPYMIQQTSASELRHDTRRNARRNKYTLTTQILTTATQTGLEADWLCSLKVEKITEKVLQQNTVYMSVNHTQSFLPPRRVTLFITNFSITLTMTQPTTDTTAVLSVCWACDKLFVENHKRNLAIAIKSCSASH